MTIDTVEIKLTARSLRRDARDFREGLYAAGTDMTMEAAADTIDALLDEIDKGREAQRMLGSAFQEIGRILWCAKKIEPHPLYWDEDLKKRLSDVYKSLERIAGEGEAHER